MDRPEIASHDGHQSTNKLQGICFNLSPACKSPRQCLGNVLAWNTYVVSLRWHKVNVHLVQVRHHHGRGPFGLSCPYLSLSRRFPAPV
jgi:hypothetical protein